MSQNPSRPRPIRVCRRQFQSTGRVMSSIWRLKNRTRRTMASRSPSRHRRLSSAGTRPLPTSACRRPDFETGSRRVSIRRDLGAAARSHSATSPRSASSTGCGVKRKTVRRQWHLRRWMTGVTEMTIERSYGFREAAEVTGMSESTLRKKAAKGLVSHFKQFRRTRFTEADLLSIREQRPARVTTSGTGRRRAATSEKDG
jgi:hypothetical protein